MCKLDDNLNDFTHKINVQPKKQAEFKDGLKFCDQAVSDLLHDLELSSLTKNELQKDVSLLIKYLRKRREYKDNLELIEAAKECNVNVLRYCAENQTRRKYRPRVLRFLAAHFDRKGKHA